MKKSKLGALALSVAVASALCIPTLAFGAVTEDSNGVGVDSATSDLMATTPGTTTLTGKIKATTLSVTIPTAMTFAIDPGATQGVAEDAAMTQKHGQFTSPSNYTVTNSSHVPVKVEVSTATATQCTLHDTKATLEAGTVTDRKVMVGLSDKANGAALDVDATAGWLSAGANLGLVPFGKTDAASGSAVGANTGKLASVDTTVTGDNKATMYVFGAVNQTGWTEGQSFTVTPTLKVTAVDSLS